MSRKTDSHSVLVLGAHASGKTTFIAQLLGRLERIQTGRLRARAAPASLTPYREALESLEEGRAPEHTSSTLFADTPIPLIHDVAGPLDLVWPEYPGESLQQIVTQRKVPEKWYARLQASEVWLLFLRLSTTFVPEDILSRRILPIVKPKSGPAAEPEEETSKQTLLVELLQMLLHLRAASTAAPLRQPVLGVVLSCFDEIQARDTHRPPIGHLAERLPLLAEFIRSSWSPSSHLVLGLSSSGQPLSHREPNEVFIFQGPEHQGYVVLPDGRDDPDLTLVVSLALDLLYA